MKYVFIGVLYIVLLMVTVDYCFYGGTIDLGEERMIELMECSKPVPQCNEFGARSDWLNGIDNCHPAIFRNCYYFVNPFSKYHFHDGNMIPRKYNYLIDAKLKCN